MLWTRDFSHFSVSSYLSIYSYPRSSGVRSGVSNRVATKRNAQITLGASEGVADKNHFWQARFRFSKISWLATSAGPRGRPEVVPPSQAENLCKGFNGAQIGSDREISLCRCLRSDICTCPGRNFPDFSDRYFLHEGAMQVAPKINCFRQGISVTFWRQAISASTAIHGHLESNLVSATLELPNALLRSI